MVDAMSYLTKLEEGIFGFQFVVDLFIFIFFSNKKGFTDVYHCPDPLKPWRIWREVHLGSNGTYKDSNPKPRTRKLMVSNYFDH